MVTIVLGCINQHQQVYRAAQRYWATGGLWPLKITWSVHVDSGSAVMGWWRCITSLCTCIPAAA